MKGDRFMFLSSDQENALVKQILETHAPDGHEIDAKPLLQIVQNIFCHACPELASQTQTAALECKAYQASDFALLESLACIIDQVSVEIARKCSGGGDAHETTMSILSMLTIYSWDVKLVIALAAFAMKYGGLWLVKQSYASNQLAKPVAILKNLPGIFENSGAPKDRFSAFRDFIKIMLDIAKYIIEKRELPSQPVTADSAALSTDVPIAVYWTIRSVMACASEITGLRHEHITSTTKVWELSSLEHKLSNIHSRWMVEVTGYKYSDEKKVSKPYQDLVKLFETNHIDNSSVLKALIYAKGDLQTLFDASAKKRVNIDVLLRKHVLLLISDLDIFKEELGIVEKVYNKFKKFPALQESQYEVLWFPVSDTSIPLTESRQRQFQDLQSSMMWYTVYHPSLIDRATIRFVKEVWRFKKKPVIVVLDPQGKVLSPNAFHMMCIWGSAAFPFTTSREETLWKAESWRLELLVDDIDPVILNWISKGIHICIYGGENMEWIKKFTTRARSVAHASGFPLGLVYVGRRNPKERIRRTISTIIIESLSHCWLDVTSIWYFWARIESIWHSKNQLGMTIENDPILPGIMTMLSYDRRADGWALLSKGSQGMALAKGTPFLKCLLDYTKWKENARKKGFLSALKDYLKELETPHQCNRLTPPSNSGVIPEKMVCPECGRSMERFIICECSDE